MTLSITYRYTIVDVRELDSETLLASNDWVDNEFAILARNADKDKVIDDVVPRLVRLRGQEQADAKATFTLLSGIVGLEQKVKERSHSKCLRCPTSWRIRSWGR